MILSNTEILKEIRNGSFSVSPLEGEDPTQPPFNTSALDLRLASELVVPKFDVPIQLDLRKGGIAKLLAQHSRKITITDEQGYALKQNQLILGKTVETVNFPLTGRSCFSARVEGRSSIARCGVLVHFTAPTIHAGFQGTITLEIINLGPAEFMLYPNLKICQLIIEEVKGVPSDAPNQFKGQSSAEGVVKKKRRKS